MIAVGAIGGFLYWYYIGCASGTCPIQSYWYTSSLYGALIGYFIGGMIKDYSQKKEKKEEENGNI